MKRLFSFCLIGLFGIAVWSSCKKGDGIQKLKKTCLYSARSDFFKKWMNAYTEIDTYSATGTIVSRSYIYPYGYFKMNIDLSYNVMSDGVPLNGDWDVTDSCQLVLDPLNGLKRTFDIVKINSDSLVIQRRDGNTGYIQHYAQFNQCPTATQLQATWDNLFTRYDYFNTQGTVISGYTYIRPVGYFKINADATYNVLSDGVPFDGTWLYNQAGCKLTLDKNTTNERTFDVMQFSNDSLTIWRKSGTQGYTQHYKKHK